MTDDAVRFAAPSCPGMGRHQFAKSSPVYEYDSYTCFCDLLSIGVWDSRPNSELYRTLADHSPQQRVADANLGKASRGLGALHCTLAANVRQVLQRDCTDNLERPGWLRTHLALLTRKEQRSLGHDVRDALLQFPQLHLVDRVPGRGTTLLFHCGAHSRNETRKGGTEQTFHMPRRMKFPHNRHFRIQRQPFGSVGSLIAGAPLENCQHVSRPLLSIAHVFMV